MVNKVYIEPLVDTQEEHSLEDEMQGLEDRPNLSIRIKNTDSLDEYKGQAFLPANFLEKLNRWINKGKY